MLITEKSNFKIEESDFKYVDTSVSKTLIIASSVGAGLIITSEPTFAQTTAASSIADVGSTIDAIATIAGAAATVVILAMGIRLAIKQVNRVMTKG